MKQLLNSLSFRLQVVAVFLSFVGVAFGLKSYLHIREVFGESASEQFWEDFQLQIVIAILANGLVTYVIYKIATKPIATLGNVMRDITEGQLQIDVPYLQQQTEIGSMARKVEVFRQNGLEKLQLEADQKKAEEEAEIAKQQAQKELADSFEENVKTIIDQLIVSSKKLYETAESMASLVKNMIHSSGEVKQASEGAMSNIANVASATKELSISASDISSQITSSTNIVNQAVEKTDSSDTSTKELVSVSSEIGDVLSMINEIAGQINLLALNATIESARAGEAGKGFAVVANEVKNLAGQTGNATEEITEKINNSQQVSQNVATDLAEIKKLVIEINQYAASIATAVDKQNHTTSEIAHNMEVATQSSQRITQNAENVAMDADKASEGAAEVLGAAEEMITKGQELQKQVADFISEIRG